MGVNPSQAKTSCCTKGTLLVVQKGLFLCTFCGKCRFFLAFSEKVVSLHPELKTKTMKKHPIAMLRNLDTDRGSLINDKY